MTLTENTVTQKMVSDLAELFSRASRDMYSILEKIDAGEITTTEAAKIINRRIEIIHEIVTQ